MEQGKGDREEGRKGEEEMGELSLDTNLDMFLSYFHLSRRATCSG